MLTLPQASAQFNVYHPFPDSGAVWGMSTGCREASCGDGGYIQNYYSGDTLIDGYENKRVLTTYVPMTSNDCCSPPRLELPVNIREDTTAKQVYVRFDGMYSDTLLYDFSLQIGDTLGGFLGNCNLFTVESIDSVLVGSSFRKRINYTSYLGDCHDLSIIEGIGSTKGLVECVVPSFQEGIGLLCFSVDGVVLYNATAPCGPDIVPCGLQLSAGSEGPGHRNIPIRIAPNPNQGQFRLEFADPILAQTHYSVCDATGRSLYLRPLPTGATLAVVDLSRFGRGIYVLRVADPKGVWQERVVVE